MWAGLPGLPVASCAAGSGKSSLMLTLYRLIDVTGGCIMLDGVDTASIALDALRRQLAIIPQVRCNVPHSPVRCRNVLHCHITPLLCLCTGVISATVELSLC